MLGGRRRAAAGGQGRRLAGSRDLAGGHGDKGKQLELGRALEAMLMAGHGAEGGGSGVPDDMQVSGSALWDQRGARPC